MTQSLLQEPVQSYEDSNGRPLNGGQLFTYDAGTLTPKATYQDAAGSTPNTNPIVLNERGEAVVYGTGNYRMILKNSVGATIWDRDNISAVGYNGEDLSAIFLSQVNRVVDTIAALRALDKTKYTRAHVTGYYAAGDGGGGNYWYDSSDTTSTDNGGTVVVANDGARWKLIHYGTLSARQFGAKGDGVTDDRTTISNAFTAAAGIVVVFPPGTYKLGSNLTAAANSRLYLEIGASFTGSTLDGVQYIQERSQGTATPGTVGAVDWAREAYPGRVAHELGLYGEASYTFAGYSARLPASWSGAGSSQVYNTLSLVMENDNPNHVPGLPLWLVANARVANSVAFGANIVVRSETAANNAKLVGYELDIQPASGTTTASGSAGVYANAFNTVVNGAFMQIGGVGGGSFINGISFSQISGAVLSQQTAATSTSFIDTTNGAFIGPAVFLGSQQRISWKKNAAGGEAYSIASDSSDNGLISILGTGSIIVRGANTTEGTMLFQVQDSGNVPAIAVKVARGGAANAANCALIVNGQSVTGRSINAGGTINASGADCAEYERKRDDCSDIAKGQIVGFDANGQLTDKFSLSVSFGIKSTNPHLVGGDVWHEAIGPEPVAPVAPVSPGLAPERPLTLRYEEFQEQIESEHAERMAAWTALVDAYKVRLGQYERDKTAYDAAKAEYDAKLEVERAKVDRIAYSGKVPVNVTGAVPGQYLIPTAQVDDTIGCALVDEASVSFCQYRLAVGQVRRILEDGRAEVVVKPI